ncbi:polyprenol phosphomannose-dependent alpha 1,6 mannosyltransferase MptB [Zafaria sp. J156]|nr:polyprenol phosphomannose-dependent alpha 1,6 mannosyltransferase MptB [Zafaria sp. J156]MEE1620658.1 polyprenol phosphomannose-dependent alpha 1,6 mannosyltransferase MptB [Zafaria sp. J156]
MASTGAQTTRPVGSAARTLASGFAGSFLVLLGSFGVGWLAMVSPLNRNALLIAVRTETWGVVLSTIVLTLGCWVLFRAWLRLGQVLSGWPEGSLATVRAASYLWSVPLLFCLPIFSRDVFAYIGQGRLVAAGQDPYQDGISTLSNWFQLGTDVTWAEAETPYGPLFLSIEHAVHQLVNASPDLSVLLFRLVAFAGVVLCIVYVPRLAELHGVAGAKALWITVANPLFLISFVASAHNDALMVGLAVAGTYYAATGRGITAVVLVTASTGIKPITMVLLPFIGLLWAGAGASWPRRFLYWGYTAGLSLGIMALIGVVNGYGFGWLSVMLSTGTGSVFFAPLGMLTTFFQAAFGALGLETAWVLPVLKTVGRIASVAVVLLLMFRGKDSHLVQRLALAFTALVVLSPIIQPWYLLWLLPFFAVTGIRDDWQLIWVYFTVAFFIAFGAADQLFIWQFLSHLDPWVKHLSTGISWAAMAYLAFLDPRTKELFRIDRAAWRLPWKAA